MSIAPKISPPTVPSKNGATVLPKSPPPPKPRIDPAPWLLATQEPGSVFEVRIFDCKNGHRTETIIGFFDDIETATKQIQELDARVKAPGIYVTLNAINPALFARSPNRFAAGIKGTTDNDILRRRWLFVDVDSVRPAGLNATDEERDAAVSLAHELGCELEREGWPKPLAGMSGNGAYLLYRIDLPNDSDSLSLVKIVLGGLAHRFNTSGAVVDVSPCNASRIAKICGTYARKGPDFAGNPKHPARPHRLSSFTPTVCDVVPLELLQQIKPPLKSPAKPAANGKPYTGPAFDIDRWIQERGLQVDGPEPWQGGRKWVFHVCPWNDQHTNKSASIQQHPSGAISASCHHNGCQGLGWHDLRDKLEPGWRDAHEEKQNHNLTTKLITASTIIAPGTMVTAGDRGNIGEVLADNGSTCTVHFVSPSGEEATKELPKSELRPLTAGSVTDPIAPVSITSLGQQFPKMRPVVIDGLLRQGEVGSVIAAPKVGKSFLVGSLALSAAYGLPWIGFQVTQGRVLIIDDELHPETLVWRLKSLAEKRGLEFENVAIDVISLRGKGRDLLTLQSTIEQLAERPAEPYRLIIVDALYKLIPKGFDENSNSDMSILFGKLDEYAAITGATILTVHHASKGNQGGKAVTDVGAGAGSQSRAVDAHLTIREHEQPEAFVVDAAVRSFSPLAAFCMRRNFPLWERDADLDPTQLKQERPRRGDRDRRGKDGNPSIPVEPWTAERFVKELVTDEPREKKTIEALAHAAGLTHRDTLRWLEVIRDKKLVHYRPARGRIAAAYSTKPILSQEELL